MKNFLLIIIIFFSFLSLFFSCDDSTGPPNNNNKINLKLEDVSCTEAWITLTTNNLQLPVEINLLRTDVNGYKVSQISLLTTKDSLLYIDSLLPNQTYKFQSVIQSINQSSNELNITTMDTTSHNFTFETFTFGEHSNSVLYDVAIIDENNIWAVGEIYLNDSLGNPDPKCYNLAVWDGSDWELKRIYYYGNCSAVEYPPLKAIWAFSENNIVITNGGSIGWFDGNTVNLDCGVNPLLTGSINKIWGTSSNDLYVVGNSGSIAHYQNGSWRRIESGTDLPIRDIFGAINNNNKYDILCVADSYGLPKGSKVLSIKNESVYELWNDGLPYGLDAIWFVPNRRYIVVGDGLWETRIPDTNWVRQKILPALHKTSIRGQNLNDIVVGGAFLLLAHWNGISWHTYFPMTSGSFTSVEIKDNILAAVGGVDTKAVVVVGRR